MTDHTLEDLSWGSCWQRELAAPGIPESYTLEDLGLGSCWQRELAAPLLLQIPSLRGEASKRSDPGRPQRGQMSSRENWPCRCRLLDLAARPPRWEGPIPGATGSAEVCNTGVCEKNVPCMQAFTLQSSSRNCSPAPDLVL